LTRSRFAAPRLVLISFVEDQWKAFIGAAPRLVLISFVEDQWKAFIGADWWRPRKDVVDV
jgi:hypothetical protein